jgi:beta-lactamase class A
MDSFRVTRRQHLAAFLPAILAITLAARAGAAASDGAMDVVAALQALEAREGGRLGVSIINTASGAQKGYRGDEAFAMCSTFKFVLAAAILQRFDTGSIRLDTPINIQRDDIVGYSPVTEPMVGKSMTVAELCRATVAESDNPAANLLLRAIDGPESVTAFLRGIGDSVTRLDRYEPHMNNANVASGDMRDTTSPAAMAATMQTILLGEVLTAASRETLTGWLKATVTGPDRLRRGFPQDWAIGHKTGTGEDGPTNDIAIAWPPGRSPLIVTVYYDRTGRTMKENATVLAEVGRIVARLA